ncbi:TetR family transcriptional regulator [Leucobacter zeae]|nr:TetR family transcriptional regulator [Leucobacter zeae]
MARPRTALLSREIIGRAAIEYVEAGNELQVVPLAKRLGVSVSSLYHHVDGREGVIKAMRQVLIPQYLLAEAEPLTWADRIRHQVELSWRMYADHPRVLQLMITVVIEEPDVLSFYSALVDALEEAGVPEDELLTTVEVIDAFCFGAALDALSPDTILAVGGADERLARLVAAQPVGEPRNRRVFDHGLGLIIAGIEARTAIA